LRSPRSEVVPFKPDPIVMARRIRQLLGGPDSAGAAPFIDALTHAPRTEGDLVRERATWVVWRSEHGQLVEPLLAALGDSDWRVQSYAAWALAVLREPRAVPGLTPLVTHAVWRLRAMATTALAEIGDNRALDVMRLAVDDPAWQVREQAVRFLGAAGGESDRRLIRKHRDDRHVAVRLAVERALATPRRP
jgi:HEAT repeat protein